MTVTVVLSHLVAQDIEAVARQTDETAGVLLASVFQDSFGNYRLIANKMVWLDDSAYDKRGPFGLSVNSNGYIRPLTLADEAQLSAIWVHTHPGINSSPKPSQHDEEVDRQVADVFRIRTGSPYYGTLIFSPIPNGLSFTGRLHSESDTTPIDRIWITGDRLQLLQSYGAERGIDSTIFDRNVRAFGGAIQTALGDLHVGIVGAGGTGSAVTEQLARLGVRKFSLFDPDHLSKSNVTRVYGSTPGDVGKPKAHILADHIRHIVPDATCTVSQSSINLEHVARKLTACDIIFGCTDDNAGRLVLSRLPTYLLTPVIDCGVLLSSGERGRLVGIDGRITWVLPGNACLICRNRIDLARASAELLTPAERVRLVEEGYAPALGDREPAVVSYTTMVAAVAVAELLERLIGYGPDPRPTEILLRWHDREVSTNIAEPRRHHYCNPESGKIGKGLSDPFLDLTWAG